MQLLNATTPTTADELGNERVPTLVDHGTAAQHMSSRICLPHSLQWDYGLLAPSPAPAFARLHSTIAFAWCSAVHLKQFQPSFGWPWRRTGEEGSAEGGGSGGPRRGVPLPSLYSLLKSSQLNSIHVTQKETALDSHTIART